MKKLILPLGIFILALLLISIRSVLAQDINLSGTSCPILGQVSQVCTGAKEFQAYQCKLDAQADCQSIVDKQEKLRAICDTYCVTEGTGMIVYLCEDNEYKRSEDEYEAQCNKPLRQLEEEYNKCRNTSKFVWKATNKVSCTVERTVCTPATIDGRRIDICEVSNEPQTNTAVPPNTRDDQNVTIGGNTLKSMSIRVLSIIDQFTSTLVRGETSLLPSNPSNTDLKPDPNLSKQQPLTGIVSELDGTADMQRADGTWVQLNQGDFIPVGAKVFTGYGAVLQIKLSDNLVVMMESLEEFSLEVFQATPGVYRKELKIESGALRFKVIQTPIKTDMKVSTPNTTASIVGTDFGVAYYKDTGLSVWEIYDGTIEVENTRTGEKKTLASSYGSPIRRLEAVNDRPMVEKTAIPKNQKGEEIRVWLYSIGLVVLVIGGLFFLKWRKRKASGAFLKSATTRAKK